MKFLILLCYYKRPNMVRHALRSLRAQTHKDWELAFVDDSGPDSTVLNIVLEELGNKNGITVYNVGDTDAQKMARGYSRFGAFWNQACRESDADIALMLCDDDALHPKYLANLNEWFTSNPQHNYCHSHVSPYDPFTQLPATAPIQGFWTNYDTPIYPGCRVDASQVAWRLPQMKAAGIWFPEQQTANLDAAVYGAMHAAWGDCYPTGFLGQYKGVYGTALTYRVGNEYNIMDLPQPPELV